MDLPVHQNAAICELVQAFDHTLLRQKFHDDISYGSRLLSDPGTICGWLCGIVVERWSLTDKLSTYVGKPSATCQTTRPTNSAFHPFGSINE